MNFHLNHIPQRPGFTISHNHSLLMVGSCFAENIGARLTEYKFKVKINPNGILFNPLSVHNCLDLILKNKTANSSLFLKREAVYYSFDHHSSVNATNETELQNKINKETQTAHQFLKTANYLIVTFGTAHIFELKSLNHVVANCHKQPQELFQKRLLSVEEITRNWSELLTGIKKLNPSLKIIFTVSPVKYLKEGLEANNLSKATLLLSVHHLLEKFEDCFYFPAYELVNDDLRDYRFYKENMAHPNEQAIDYVWEKFSECYFNPDTKKLNHEIHKLNLALNHRTMNPASEENRKLDEFIRSQQQEIMKLMPQFTP